MTDLATLQARRDTAFAVAKIAGSATGIIFALMILGVASKASSDRILLSADLAHLANAWLVPVDTINALAWGGRTTSNSILLVTLCISFTSLFILVRRWLSAAKISAVGIALLAAVLALYSTDDANPGGLFKPAFIKPDAFVILLDHIERAQPGLLARLRQGERSGLPANGPRYYQAYEQYNRAVAVLPKGPPVANNGVGEALRFALIQDAFIRKDKAAIRRMAPIGPMPSDKSTAFDVIRRVNAASFSAGQNIADPRMLADWNAVSNGWKHLDLVISVARPIYWTIFTIMAAAFFLGILLRRRIRKLEYLLASKPAPITRGRFGRKTMAR